jgi:hypothetical protein
MFIFTTPLRMASWILDFSEPREAREGYKNVTEVQRAGAKQVFASTRSAVKYEGHGLRALGLFKLVRDIYLWG